MAMLDIFNNDAFSVVSLTEAMDLLPYKPGRIGEMNLFDNKPSNDKYAVIEERDGKLALIPTTARGETPAVTAASRPRRKTKAFEIPHMETTTQLLAAELMGKRAFATDDEVESFSEVLNDVMQTEKENYEVTWEWRRLGAIKGIVLDADGVTVIENLFTAFGQTQKTVTFNFQDTGNYDNAVPAQDMKQVCTAVKREIARSLGGTGFSDVNALCGARFFDSLVKHVTVRRAYDAYTGNPFQAQLQSEQGRKKGFEFGEITWEEYRGAIGDVDFVNTGECHFVPRGVPGMFLEVPGPADFIETVNTRGKMLYVKQKVLDFDEGVQLKYVSNVMYMCSRPSALIKGVGTNMDAVVVISS